MIVVMMHVAACDDEDEEEEEAGGKGGILILIFCSLRADTNIERVSSSNLALPFIDYPRMIPEPRFV